MIAAFPAAALLLLAAQPAAEDNPPAERNAALSFSAARAFERQTVRIRAGWLGREGQEGEPAPVWFERVVIRDDGGRRHMWTTSLACPGSRAVFGQVDRIELPRLTNPRSDGSFLATFDGTWYTLDRNAYYGAEGRSGRIRLESNVGTGLAAWVDAMLAVLDPCWTSRRPAL